MVHIIYPAELQLNKANASDTEAAFLDLNLSIHNDIMILLIFGSLMAMSVDVPLMVYIRGLLFKFVDFPHCCFNTAFISY